MKIAHAALWTRDIDRACRFWQTQFGAAAGELYASRNRPGFRSRFLRFAEGPTLEIMSGPWVGPRPAGEDIGYAHLAIALGTEESVDAMAARARDDGTLVSGPRWTGDGFYEAVIRDPDGNLVEITA
jgi:lactoylglutathione lyase